MRSKGPVVTLKHVTQWADLGGEEGWEVVGGGGRTEFVENTEGGGALVVGGVRVWGVEGAGGGLCYITAEGGGYLTLDDDENPLVTHGKGEDHRWLVTVTALPNVDLESLLDGTDKAATARHIISSASEVGFFTVTNHTLDTLIPPLLATAHATLPPTDMPLLKLNLASTTGLVKSTAGEEPKGLELPPWWSEEGRAAVAEYFERATKVALEILKCVLEELGVAEDVRDTGPPYCILRMMCYSAGDGVGLTPHTDKTWLTLLLQDATPGLEVEGRSFSTWLPVPATPNIVVNIGDALQTASKGILKSKIHRAVLPTASRRLSFPLFVEPTAWPKEAAPTNTVYVIREL